ncbi:plasmid replication initiation protein [Pedobacter sp. CG_S7]|uniref:replication initiation protein n=1 Tax=Pedobacter sp. CG_S7 TaxID=3143930 RepID=UPI0033969013
MKPKRQYNRQPNIITKSSSEMTLIEKRIMYLVINRLDVGFDVQPDLFKNMEFKINFDQVQETNYKRVVQAVKKLQTRVLTIVDDDMAEEYEAIIPFPKVKAKGGVITLTMLADVVPYFLELKKGFTKYELAAALALNSIYAQKLYELFSRWKDKKEWYVPLVQLQKLLKAGNYNYKDFRVNCLEKGIEEINNKTDLFVSYEAEKMGRSVTDILFTILPKPTGKEEAEQVVKEELKMISDMSPAQVHLYTQKLLNDYSFTPKQQEAIMSSTDLFNRFIELESKIANGLIEVKKTPTALMAHVLFKKK